MSTSIKITSGFTGLMWAWLCPAWFQYFFSINYAKLFCNVSDTCFKSVHYFLKTYCKCDDRSVLNQCLWVTEDLIHKTKEWNSISSLLHIDKRWVLYYAACIDYHNYIPLWFYYNWLSLITLQSRRRRSGGGERQWKSGRETLHSQMKRDTAPN